MKKLLALLLALVMVLSLAACGNSNAPAATEAPKAEAPAAEAPAADTGSDGDASNDPAVTLVYAEVNPLDSIVGQTATYFGEQVKELTGGTVTLDIQASGVLGSENDVLDNILAGGDTIDLSRISAFALTSYGAQKSVLLSLPSPSSPVTTTGTSPTPSWLPNS